MRRSCQLGRGAGARAGQGETSQPGGLQWRRPGWHSDAQSKGLLRRQGHGRSVDCVVSLHYVLAVSLPHSLLVPQSDRLAAQLRRGLTVAPLLSRRGREPG